MGWPWIHFSLLKLKQKIRDIFLCVAGHLKVWCNLCYYFWISWFPLPHYASWTYEWLPCTFACSSWPGPPHPATLSQPWGRGGGNVVWAALLPEVSFSAPHKIQNSGLMFFLHLYRGLDTKRHTDRWMDTSIGRFKILRLSLHLWWFPFH